MTTVLVASGGGHLRQLLSLQPRLELPGPFVWATPESGLAEDFLADQTYYPIPYIPARDWRGAIRLTRRAGEILAETEATRIISTGAAPAPPFFLAGAVRGLELHYIESATRSAGPSMSGKLVAAIPTANLYTQYPELAGRRWHYRGSIFDPYEVESATPQPQLGSVVVTLGTEKFGFRRAVEKLLEVLPPGADVLWQTGSTNTSGLPIDGVESLPGAVLQDAIAAADVVVSHAGTGSAITAFDAGKRPLLLPREARFDEHIDDHQLQTAGSLGRRGLAVAPRVEDLNWSDVERCRESRIVRTPNEPPFRLRTRGRLRR